MGGPTRAGLSTLLQRAFRMETLVTVLIIEIQQDERATPSGTGTPTPPLPASGSLCSATCPPSLLLLGVHHWHPLEDPKGSVSHSHPALLPSPDLLDGRHHLLDVILGPAPGLGPHGPAGHAGGAGAASANSQSSLTTFYYMLPSSVQSLLNKSTISRFHITLSFLQSLFLKIGFPLSPKSDNASLPTRMQLNPVFQVIMVTLPPQHSYLLQI